MSKQIGNSGEENIFFNRKRPPAEPGKGRRGHLAEPTAGEGSKAGQRHTVKEHPHKHKLQNE